MCGLECTENTKTNLTTKRSKRNKKIWREKVNTSINVRWMKYIRENDCFFVEFGAEIE